MTAREEYLLIGGVVLIALFYWKRKEVVEVTANAATTIKDAFQPRGIRNNNPGNLKKTTPHTPWQGLRADQSGDDVFYQFISPEYGIRALSRDLTTKYNRGLLSIRQIIDVYAPPSENNTAAYIAAVSKRVGKGADERLIFPADKLALMMAIIQHENGQQPYSVATINAGLAIA